jgi:hypothetical protein
VTEAPSEVAVLRARLQELEDQLAVRDKESATIPGPTRDRQWWRAVVVVALVTLATILAPLTVVARWAHDEVGDTDRFLETITPLASEPAVQKAISDRISTEIFAYIDVRDITADALTALAQQEFVPPRAAGVLPSLSVPLSAAIENFVRERVDQVVRSDAFSQAWIGAVRQAHTQMVAVLTGNTSEAVDISDGAVKVNIATFVAAVKQKLVSEGFSFANRVPEVNASFTIFEAPNIGVAQKWFGWLDTLARVLPILVILLLLAAVMVARDRRRTLLAAGLSIAGSMVLLGLCLNIVRPIYLDAIPSGVIPGDAAAAIYDTLVQFIRSALRAVGVIFLAIALAAFWFAPTGAGAAIRAGAASALDRLRRRSGRAAATGPVGQFLTTYRTFVRVVIVSLGALAYLALDHPTGGNAVTAIIAVVVGLILVEFFAAPAPPESAPVTSTP